MKRIFWPIVVMALFALRLTAQTSLEFFTNQANTLLEQQFGFGVTNIPIYSTAAPSNAYSSSWHYWLQAAANAYDATTPATNSPSVFRPLFGWSSNTLYIVGYTNVTSDFYAQIAAGFKQIDDPTITTNDNVWGIPWVVGMKGSPPAFNEYSYVTDVMAERQLLFPRAISGGQPETNRPPVSTNQIFILSVSNVFGLDAWNYSPSNYPDPVTVVTSNQVSILLTNNYDWGTNYEFTFRTNWIIESWSGTDSPSNASFILPLFTNVAPLSPSYWSDSTGQLVLLDLTNYTLAESILLSDLRQTGWPEHNWTLSISNNLMYALIDNPTGLVLDFVNLSDLNSSIPITQTLETQLQGGLNSNDPTIYWLTNGATDAPESPMSTGIVDQIQESENLDPEWAENLTGLGNSPDPILAAAYVPLDVLEFAGAWRTISPKVHFTVEDLNSLTNLFEYSLAEDPDGPSPVTVIIPPLDEQITIGKRNISYNSGTVEGLTPSMSAGLLQLNFAGAYHLPYTICASTNLSDWIQLGAAAPLSVPPYRASFQFTDTTVSNFPTRFYQIRLP